MFAISSGHTKTISLRNQMERIIPERLRMENSLSYFDFFFLHPFFFFFFLEFIAAVKAWNICVHTDLGSLTPGGQFGSVAPRSAGKYSICL